MSYKQIKQNDPDFRFSPDGVMVVPRAAIEVSSSCPSNYRDIIQECINHGWLKPVAYMRDAEYTMELLYK